MITKVGRKVFKFTQKVLVFISLVLIYVFLFGITAIFVRIFRRKLVRTPPKESLTFWEKAEGFKPTLKEAEVGQT